MASLGAYLSEPNGAIRRLAICNSNREWQPPILLRFFCNWKGDSNHKLRHSDTRFHLVLQQFAEFLQFGSRVVKSLAICDFLEHLGAYLIVYQAESVRHKVKWTINMARDCLANEIWDFSRQMLKTYSDSSTLQTTAGAGILTRFMPPGANAGGDAEGCF